jgi:hypothetical protein
MVAGTGGGGMTLSPAFYHHPPGRARIVGEKRTVVEHGRRRPDGESPSLAVEGGRELERLLAAVERGGSVYLAGLGLSAPLDFTGWADGKKKDIVPIAAYARTQPLLGR